MAFHKIIIPPANDIPVGETGFAIYGDNESIFYRGWVVDTWKTIGEENLVDWYAGFAKPISISKTISIFRWKMLNDHTLSLTPICGRVYA